MTIRKTVANFITSIIAVLVILLSGIANSFAFAAETGSIMQDLSTLTVDGKAFNAEDYPADETGTPQLITAYEVGYSFYVNKQDDFGLLLYIYNPSQIAVVDDIRNTVQLKVGSSQRYDKYSIKLIETSEDKLFCKLKVNFTDEEKSTVLENVDRDGRRYEVSTIELYEGGPNATSYPVERVYIFTGYGKGYGQTESESTLSGTLNYTEEGGTASESIEVHHTTWRPEGSKEGAGKYVQDSIHSVYFAIPNDLAAQYDYLNSVKCEWIEALTAPIFVTGNAEIYKAVQYLIKSQKGQVIDDGNIETGAGSSVPSATVAPEEFDFSNFNYALVGGRDESVGQTSAKYTAELTLNVGGSSFDSEIAAKERLKALYWNIYAGDIDVGDYVVTSAEVAQYANTIHPFYNDKKVAGKYPSYLFDSWETEKHNEVISVGKEYELTSEKVEHSLWLGLFDKMTVSEQQQFKNIKAIQEVESLTGNQATDCANYFISERDYDEFSEFYTANKDNATVYLLRFATSDYTQMQVCTYQYTSGLESLLTPIKNIDTNAYFAQTKTYLDFDIIDLEYVKDDVNYVIPVNMSPIDIFPEVTPPVYWDEPVSDFWKYGCGIIAGLIAFYAIYKVADKTIKEYANGR